jgi:predicted protein tyrosine phosphatase
MEFVCLSREKAAEFKPRMPTYVIRILDCLDKRPLLPMFDCDYFRCVDVYRFDDAIPESFGSHPIGREVAVKLLSDFSSVIKRYRDIQQVMIHCNEGKSRSPAVAGALKHIFFQDFTHWDISIHHPDFNEHVYHQLVYYSKELGLSRLSQNSDF